MANLVSWPGWSGFVAFHALRGWVRVTNWRMVNGVRYYRYWARGLRAGWCKGSMLRGAPC